MNSNVYYLVRIKPNPEASIDPERKKELGEGHHSYIDNLTEKGVIRVGGPIEEKAGGMIVVKAENKEEVVSLFSEDPMVSAGALNIEVNTWNIKHGDPTILA